MSQLSGSISQNPLLERAPLPQQRVATSDGTNLDSTRTDDMGESNANVRIEVRAVDTLSPNSQWRTLVPIAQARQCDILTSPPTE